MPNLIEVQFCDESWEKIIQFIEETKELKDLKYFIEAKKMTKSLPLRDLLKVSRD